MATKDQIELVKGLDHVHRETVIETIAAACHQQNRTYCDLMGDHSQVPWTEAESWQKDSAIEGVKNALVNPNPAASHESWLEHKRADGWTYGDVKDPEAKTHPCMVPYGDLPEAQKRKDSFFVEMVQQLGVTAGLIRINNGGDET
jgi:hypothetical protein